MNFESFNLHPTIMAGIRAMRYETPTSVQSQAVPPALEGRDIVGLAQTGSGKTTMFALSILQRLRSKAKDGVRALVISATRERAERTSGVINELGERAGLMCLAIHGDVSLTKQLRELRNGPTIIAACPARLLAHLWKGTIKIPELEVLVIDEADRLSDIGFLPEIQNILDYIEHRHQTLLFSAAMSDGIRRLVRDSLHDPVTIQVGPGLPAKSVSLAPHPLPRHLKTELLKRFLDTKTTGSALIFTRTRHRAEQVARQLVQAGYQISSLQGKLSQHRRQAALRGFRDGMVKIIVVTDVASRGIDLRNLSRVINDDMPGTNDDATRRMGRTGQDENAGDAMTFVTEVDERRIQELEQLLESPLERLTLPGFCYGQPTLRDRPAR